MARAETLDPTGENGEGNNSLPNNYCILPCPLLAPSQPRLLTSNISTGTHVDAMHFHQNNHLEVFPWSQGGGEGRAERLVRAVLQSGSRRLSVRQEVLPDLLPHNEPPPRPPAAAQDVEIRRTARRLRTIGDELDAAMLRRARFAFRWRDWRDVCRAIFNFIGQTLGPLHRLT